MQKVSGNGIVFAEFDGHVVEYELQPGQQIVIDSGYLAAMSVTCQMDIQTVPGLKNIVFGGEGLLIRLLQDRDMYGFRQCRLAVWQIH